MSYNRAIIGHGGTPLSARGAARDIRSLMPRSAAYRYRPASAPPLCGFAPPPACLLSGGALRRLGALRYTLRRLGCASCGTCAATPSPRATRAAGLRGSSSSAPVQDFARVRLTCGAVTSATLSTRRNALAVRRLSHSPPLSRLCAPLRRLRRLASRAALPRPRRLMGAPPTYTAARRDSGLFVLRAAFPIIAAAVGAPGRVGCSGGS